MLLAFLSLFATYETVVSNVRIIKVISNSMAPKFHRGDLVLVKPIPVTQLKVGQIAILPLVDGSNGYYFHRITKVRSTDSGTIIVKTKGDANPIADDWQLEVTSPKIPVFLSQFPTFGLTRIFQSG